MWSKKSNKIISFLLYSIPVLFFIVSYFIIVTSGEDIWQGAASNVDIINDSLAAFRHSVRLADMFAWSVINFFDYIYSFGPDTIFRILDVVMAFSIYYMATYIVIRRRPRLILKDALVFSMIFLLTFLTSNGLTLYAGFSKIHNYLFITFFFFAFSIFYIKDLWGEKLSNSIWFALFMCILGFVFGFASNVTAIVFLFALVLFAFYKYFKSRKNSKERKDFWQGIRAFLSSWRFAGVIGILASVALMYLVGNGLGDYETSEVYYVVLDFLPFSHIWADVPSAIIRIIKHNAYNFARFLGPFFLASIPVLIISFLVKKKKKIKFPTLSNHDKDYLVASLLFIFMHIFSLSQIYYPTRLVLPAYIYASSIFLWLVILVIRPLFHNRLAKEKTKQVIGIILLIISLTLLLARSFFAISYVKKAIPVFERIKNSSEDVLCISQEEVKSPWLIYIHLGQEEYLVDWAMPQNIYKKTIYICEN